MTTGVPPRTLGHGELLQLRRWNTPTIYNGWELLTSHRADGKMARHARRRERRGTARIPFAGSLDHGWSVIEVKFERKDPARPGIAHSHKHARRIVIARPFPLSPVDAR
jgi:hypothetical protein